MIKKNKLALILIIFMALNLAITSLPSQIWAEDQAVIDFENLADDSADPDPDFGNSEDGLGIAGDELPDAPGQEGVEAVEQPQGESVEEPPKDEGINPGEQQFPSEEEKEIENPLAESHQGDLLDDVQDNFSIDNLEDQQENVLELDPGTINSEAQRGSQALTLTKKSSSDPNSQEEYIGEFDDFYAAVDKMNEDKLNPYILTVNNDINIPATRLPYSSVIDINGLTLTIKSNTNSGRCTITRLSDGSIRRYAFNISNNSNVTMENIAFDGGNNNQLAKVNSSSLTLGDEVLLSHFLTNFTTNNGVEEGAVIHIYNGSVVNINSGAELSNNTAMNNFTGIISVNPGAILNFNGGKFNNNSAKWQGRMIYSKGTVNINSGEINHNTMQDESIMIENMGKIIIKGGVIANNTVSKILSAEDYPILLPGNIIRCLNNSYIEINAGEFKNNNSYNDGGFIYSEGGQISIQGGNFVGNRSGKTGGVISALAGKIDITGGNFSQNSAVQGGAIYLGIIKNKDDESITLNKTTISGANFTSNEATAEGGAIFTTPYEYKPEITDPTAYKNLTIDDTTVFTGNTAGGGLYAPPSNYGDFKNLQFDPASDVQHGTLTEESLLNNYDINYVKPYNITFDANGGVCADGRATITTDHRPGESIKIIDAPIKEGYIFDYWEGSKHYPGDSYTVTEDHTFVAKWKQIADNATITFDANGGVFADGTNVKSEEYEKGEEITIINAPTREGYTFDYWKGSEYQPGDKYTVVEDHTFVAQWNEEPTPSEIPEIVLPGPILPRPLTVSPPAVVKQIKGGQPATADSFTFRIEAVGYKALAGQQANLPEPWSLPLPQGTDYNRRTPEGTATLIQIQGAGSVLFGQMTYTKPGDYTYKITEVSDQNMPYIFDKTVYTFTDHVYEQGDKLVSDRTLLRNGQPINSITAYFNNEYTGTNSLQEQVQQLPATGYKESLGLGLCLLSAGLLFFIKKKA